MSARTIGNWKERLITILVTPLMSCSARLPVYTLLISLIVPAEKTFGFFNLQGLILMGMYLLGFVAALLTSFIMKLFIRAKEKSYFIMEMPVYRSPRWINIGLMMLGKIKVFLFDAGKVIIAISIILWALATHAPSGKFDAIDAKYSSPEFAQKFSAQELQNIRASEKLQASYAGLLGKALEPAIAPLGFDWKIGIALVTSFAAREVFVGTMATIYSVGDAENTQSIRQKMLDEKNPETGKKVYSLAVCLSLMLFYAFALQCMSTVAVVYRETKTWKWPVIQFLLMGGLAYVSSLTLYQSLK
jgi:ferrous iron transport protein B